MKVSKTEELSPVESFDEWKEKAAELKQSLAEAEKKIDTKKGVDKDYKEIQTLLADLQVSVIISLWFLDKLSNWYDNQRFTGRKAKS